MATTKNNEFAASKVSLETVPNFPTLRKIRIDGPEGKEELTVDLDELNQLKNLLKATNCGCKK